MTEQRKRKAADQLSPYSEDPNESLLNEITSADAPSEQPIFFKKARARKGKEVNQDALKGIFGTISLGSEQNEPKQKKMNDMIAGLNKSFLKALNMVVERQSNKDLTYLFVQYEKFIKDIKENNKV